jgi:hypothetical protein
MQKTKKTSRGVIWILALSFALSCAAFTPASAEETATPEAAPAPSLVGAINRARIELSARLEAKRAAGELKKQVAEEPIWATVTIAIWNRETDGLRYVTVRKSGRRVERVSGDLPLPTVTYSKQDSSLYAVPDPEEIVGVLYPVAKAVDGAYKITYTYVLPLTEALYVPEVIAAGSDYLSGRIREALDDLRTRGVKSVAFPDCLLADVADPYLVKTIVIIEHTTHTRLLSDFQPEKEMGEFLARLGLRADSAYGGAVSSAGAQGLAQFIPSTYNLLVKQRPELGLIKGFDAGMGDHLNALKAEIAYLDDCLADMPRDVRDTYRVNPQAGAAVLAASYNGGSTRVRRAIASWGEEWDEVHRNQNGYLYASSLRSETAWYVAKMRKVYGMLEGGYYATPNTLAAAPPVAPAAAPPAAAEQPVALTAPAGGQSAIANIPSAVLPAVICFDGSGCVRVN